MLLRHLLNAGFKLRIQELRGCFIAFCLKILLMSQCVLDIKQFLVSHCFFLSLLLFRIIGDTCILRKKYLNIHFRRTFLFIEPPLIKPPFSPLTAKTGVCCVFLIIAAFLMFKSSNHINSFRCLGCVQQNPQRLTPPRPHKSF